MLNLITISEGLCLITTQGRREALKVGPGLHSFEHTAKHVPIQTAAALTRTYSMLDCVLQDPAALEQLHSCSHKPAAPDGVGC
jgi:hypothetical protein